MNLKRTGSRWDRNQRININDNWDAIEQWLNQLAERAQDLVAEGQLTPAQYAELITTINGLISKGNVSVDDIDINRGKLLPRHMSEELLQMIAGDAPVNAVPADGSITSEKYADRSVTARKVSFLSQSRNLFSGEYDDGILTRYSSSEESGYSTRKNYDGLRGKIAVVPISNGQTYTLKVHSEKTTGPFRLAFNSSYPVYGVTFSEQPVDQLIVDDPTLTEYTFTNNYGHGFLIAYIALEGIEHTLQVEVGNQATDYVPGLYLPPRFLSTEEPMPIAKNSITPEVTTFFEGENLFDGEYVDGMLLFNNDRVAPVQNYDEYLGKTAIVEVEPNTTYFINVGTGSNVLRVGLNETEAEFSVYPDRRYLTSAPYASAAGPYVDSLEIFTGPDDRYMYIYVSNDGTEPELSVESKQIPRRFLDIGDLVYEKDHRYSFAGDFDTVYLQPEITDFISNPNTITPSEYHTMFQSLGDDHSDIFKYTSVGEDDFGNESFIYELKPWEYHKADAEGLDRPDHTKLKNPKIIISAGVHGRERSANFIIYYLVREFLENRANNDNLDAHLTNIHFIFYPMVNPSGFEDNSYENRNGQNLNRDFPVHGNATQPETQALKNLLDSNTDADYFIDMHNLWLKDDTLGYSLTDDPFFIRSTMNMYKAVGRERQKAHPEMPQEVTHRWGYTSRANVGTVGKYAQEILGIPSTLLESPRQDHFFGTGVHSEFCTRVGIDILVNTLNLCVKNKM